MANNFVTGYPDDPDGKKRGVIVSLEEWRNIQSEMETAHLLKSEAMKRRLLEAKERQEGISIEEVREKLGIDPAAFEDLAWWVRHDREEALRIMNMIEEIQRDPSPEISHAVLRRELAGCWSLHIYEEHSIVYQIKEEKIRILTCRYHY